MRVINDTLFLATDGGIMAITDPDLPGVQFTNLDGLGTVDITDIIEDSEGQKWVTGFGELIKFNGRSCERFPSVPVDGTVYLRCVVDDSNYLWIGSDSGLFLFSKVGEDGGGFRYRYGITVVNAYPPVYDILLDGDSIWLATLNGLAVADRSDPIALYMTSSWTVFDMSTNPELGENQIRRVKRFGDSLYVITSSGLFWRGLGGSDTSFTEIPAGGSVFFDLRIDNDTLFVYHSGGLGVVSGGVFTSLGWPKWIPKAPFTGFNNGEFRWLATLSRRGVWENRSGFYEEYVHTGTPHNRVSDVTIGADGAFTAGFIEKRAATLVNGFWVTHEYEPAFGTSELFSDIYSNTWIGTVGGGLWRADDTSLVNFNDSNSTVVGNEEDHDFAWVTGIVGCGQYLFVSIFQSYTDCPVAVARLDDGGCPVAWTSFGSTDGITDIGVVDIDYHNAVLVVASGNSGVFYCSIGPDPFDKADDFCINFREDNSFILSDVIRVVRFSPSGELWVGTNSGVSRLDEDLGMPGEIGRFVDVSLPSGFGPDITAMEFDSWGNIWIGAENGLVRIDVSSGGVELYTMINSRLVCDEIRNLTIDTITGDLYVSTAGGISRYISSTGRLTSMLELVLARPNPFVIDSHDDGVGFGFARPHTLQIFSVAGELVWEATALSHHTWGGRNQSGEPVASGVYFFLLQDAEGNVGKGKFLLVRNR